MGELLPAADETGFLIFLEQKMHVLGSGEPGDHLGRGVVYLPLEGRLNHLKSTCLTVILSTKMERKKLNLRGREILDYFLFLRYTFEYLVIPNSQSNKGL